MIMTSSLSFKIDYKYIFSTLCHVDVRRWFTVNATKNCPLGIFSRLRYTCVYIYIRYIRDSLINRYTMYFKLVLYLSFQTGWSDELVSVKLIKLWLHETTSQIWNFRLHKIPKLPCLINPKCSKCIITLMIIFVLWIAFM